MHMLTTVFALFLLATSANEASARICPRNKNFPLIDKGMTLDELTKLIGRPVSAESGPDDSKVLFYCLASSFLDSDGSDTREYWVQMMQGKVIGYGERTDAAAMHRAQRQHASAWAIANTIVNSANEAADRMTHTPSPTVNTQVTVQQNVVVRQAAMEREPDQREEEKAKPDWRRWDPN